MTPQNNERRKHSRYPVEDSGAVMVYPVNVISYCLLNISERGLAFTYNSNLPVEWINKRCFLDFFGENFVLENLSIKIISDTELNPSELPSELKVEQIPNLRRCGVKFMKLTDTQEKPLFDYIKKIKQDDLLKKRQSVIVKIHE